jgi:hypothetical protein
MLPNKVYLTFVTEWSNWFTVTPSSTDLFPTPLHSSSSFCTLMPIRTHGLRRWCPNDQLCLRPCCTWLGPRLHKIQRGEHGDRVLAATGVRVRRVIGTGTKGTVGRLCVAGGLVGSHASERVGIETRVLSNKEISLYSVTMLT